MTLGITVPVRNSMLQAIENAMDANNANGILIIYDGARPATNGANTNVLAYLVLSKPAGSIAAGVLTFNTFGSEPAANATGTATWARVLSGNLIPVYDCSVGTSAADIILNTTSIVQNAAVNVTSGTITAGNP